MDQALHPQARLSRVHLTDQVALPTLDLHPPELLHPDLLEVAAAVENLLKRASGSGPRRTTNGNGRRMASGSVMAASRDPFKCKLAPLVATLLLRDLQVLHCSSR